MNGAIEKKIKISTKYTNRSSWLVFCSTKFDIFLRHIICCLQLRLLHSVLIIFYQQPTVIPTNNYKISISIWGKIVSL